MATPEPEVRGANNNERLLAAARSDNEELLLEIFDDGEFDINCQDGLGNTPLHNAVMHGSVDVLEHILSHEECDVDPINRIDKATPLHLAVQLEDPELRLHIVGSLLEAGADTTLKDKNGFTVPDIVSSDDTAVLAAIRKAKAQDSISNDDIAHDDDDDDDGEGSGSDSE
ncbi:hypothetical protein H1R20_g12744, partial [Candolleomyces eurysporus]